MSKKLFLTNTLTGKKEEFKSITPDEVGMYNCGPTVYDFAHIGNLRSYVFADILRRTLELNGYNVKQVINITDIGHLASDDDDGDDKMTKGLKREGKELNLENMKWLADKYTAHFEEDLKDLNIKLPDFLPKASEHIKEDIELIEKLDKKGFVYRTEDGIYFDTSKDAEYGKLGNIKMNDDASESRIGLNSEKRNPKDFAVWKFNNALGYESPWSKGFPGWHIECSAMSMKYLGETFDIHTGGIDHIPVHHNNEIAQSESATGKKYANVWLHNAFVNIEGGKMAKSEGNFFRIQTLKNEGISPLAYRYWLLGGRYNTPMNFSWEALEGAQNAFEKLRTRVIDLGVTVGEVNNEYQNKFIDLINDDLDTPQSLALTWELLNDKNISNSDKLATLFFFDKVLGFSLESMSVIIYGSEIPFSIHKLEVEREIARNNKDFAKSDELRAEIEKHGYSVKDTPEGQKIDKRR